MAGSSTAEAAAARPSDEPAFYFDLASPECYLVAERILHELPFACAWRPVLGSELPGGLGIGGWRCAEERDIALGAVERSAFTLGLQPVRWPDDLPFDSLLAQRAATYARQIGRAVPFAQAAFRQAFAGGRSLSVPENILIAGSACEMHPAALLKSLELRGVRAELERTTAEAVGRGVRSVPAIVADGAVFHGDASLGAAARALTA